MTSSKRRVADALGEMEVDEDAQWGAQTQRALLHFDIGLDPDSGERMPQELLLALIRLKGIAAAVNGRLGRLEPEVARAIDDAATELLLDTQALRTQFPLSLWQSGSGTQSHMNVNEVLARIAELQLGTGHTISPNDHVNLGQSSNDMMPTAMHVALVTALKTRLQPALESLAEALHAQALRHADLIKLGRTHLQDAVPLTVGQEVGGWRSALLLAGTGIEAALPALRALAIGGTAVGTGLNTHVQFAGLVCRELARRTGISYTPAPDRFAALAGHEPVVLLHGALKALAMALLRIANDLRLLASGPRGGLGEWQLPANEPGSSIMPGKINPTQCEALAMVCCQVVGNDAAIAMGAGGGHLQLNTFKPLIAANALRSVRLLADAMLSFKVHTVRGMQPDGAQMRQHLTRSLMLVTALTPHIGYERAARIALRAHAEGLTLREAALQMGLNAADFDRWAAPEGMLGPTA